MVMSVEEYTECFSRALGASDIEAIGALDAGLRDVVESEIQKINGDIAEQRQLTEKLTALNMLYKKASTQLQKRREDVRDQFGAVKAARAYQQSAYNVSEAF